uniref:Mediator of RNA polymerase II transcription subunit 10 n=1 Tax=Phasianus colchicus TaxID=9054 RepID=A0A669P497_PHACC
MAMAEKFDSLEEHLEKFVENIRQLGIIVSDFQPSSQAGLNQKLNFMVTGLQDIDKCRQQLHDISVPLEVFESWRCCFAMIQRVTASIRLSQLAFHNESTVISEIFHLLLSLPSVMKFPLTECLMQQGKNRLMLAGTSAGTAFTIICKLLQK